MTKAGNQVRGLDPPYAPPQPALDTTIIVSAGEGGWWAWEDLNLRPHPYQLNAGNRCANRPFPSSRPTVGAQGMRSISPLVCVLANALGTHRLDVVSAGDDAAMAWRPRQPRPGPPIEAAADSVASPEL